MGNEVIATQPAAGGFPRCSAQEPEALDGSANKRRRERRLSDFSTEGSPAMATAHFEL